MKFSIISFLYLWASSAHAKTALLHSPNPGVAISSDADNSLWTASNRKGEDSIGPTIEHDSIMENADHGTLIKDQNELLLDMGFDHRDGDPLEDAQRFSSQVDIDISTSKHGTVRAAGDGKSEGVKDAMHNGESVFDGDITTEEGIKLARICALLSMHSYEDKEGVQPVLTNPEGDYNLTEENYTLIQPEVAGDKDAAVVVKLDDVCHLNYQATKLTNFNDWAQNLETSTKRAEFLGDEANNCQVGHGFLMAYRFSQPTTDSCGTDNTCLVDQVEELLEACMGTCGEEVDCTVVISGHSQGGSAAAIAAWHFQSMNPYLITFGMPKTFLHGTGSDKTGLPTGCGVGQGDDGTGLDPDRSFHFVNTKAIGYETVADMIPLISFGAVEAFVGQTIYLSNADVNDAVAIKESNPPADGPMDVTMVAHCISTYKKDASEVEGLGGLLTHCPPATGGGNHGYLNKLNALSKFPLERTLSNNDLCVFDFECESEYCNKDPFKINHCKELGEDGVQCRENADCKSKRCDHEKDDKNSYKVCRQKIETIGGKCNEDSDCDTGRCDESKCQEKEGSCEKCNENSDCNSGKCVSGSCAEADTGKLKNDCERCNYDSNCESGYCKRSSTPYTCTAKIATGNKCTENDDCVSGACESQNWGGTKYCTDKLGIDKSCNEDSDCTSGRCDPKESKTCSESDGRVEMQHGLRLGGICKYKSKPGCDCNENSDCESGKCTCDWKCDGCNSKKGLSKTTCKATCKICDKKCD